MKTLYVLGSSTCYGMDLTPGKTGLSMREFRETYNFAGLLGKELGYKVVNNSYPIHTLSSMIRKIKEEYDVISPDISIIGIPAITAREMWDPDKGCYINLAQKEFYFPKTVLQKDTDGVPLLYESKAQKEHYLSFRKNFTIEKGIDEFEHGILELQDFLKQKEAKYIFVQMSPIIPNLIDENGYTDDENTIKHFRNYFKRLNEIDIDKWLKFDEFNAVDNLKHVPKGRTGHILVEGHLILKELLYEKLRDTYL